MLFVVLFTYFVVLFGTGKYVFENLETDTNRIRLLTAATVGLLWPIMLPAIMVSDLLEWMNNGE